MNSLEDSGVTRQHIFSKDIADTQASNNKRAITSYEIQNKLYNSLAEYSENNPEPPFMKD